MADENLELKTRYRQNKEQNDELVYNRFTELMEKDGAQILEVNKVIKNEFEFVNSDATIWAIRKRVEERKKNKKI